MSTKPLSTDATGRFLAFAEPLVADNRRPSPDVVARCRAAWDRVSGH